MNKIYRNKICCLQGTDVCQQILEEAQKIGLTVGIPHPKISPETLEIISTRTDNFVANQFLEKYENNPEIVILYGYHHPKCQKNVFRSHVLPKSEAVYQDHSLMMSRKLQGSNIHNLPDRLVPAEMRGYYSFPSITPEQRKIRPKIGIISLGGYYMPSDLEYYWDYNLQRWDPRWGWEDIQPIGPIDHIVTDNILPEFDRDIYSLENTLDIELIGGFCPSAEIHFYSARNTYQGYLDAFKDAISDQMDIVSTSWGGSEESFYGVPSVITLYNEVFKAGTTGKDTQGNVVSDHYTIFTAASGDYGSSDNNYNTYNIPPYPVTVPVPHCDFPCSSPWVTACGGTSLFYDLDSQIDEETAWTYGGGGQSSQFRRPDYQGEWNPIWPISPIAYKDPGTGKIFARTVPDLAYNSDPNSPWYARFAGYDDEVAGTSGSSPITAGMLGEFYCASKTNTAPRNGYFGEGFNTVFYRAPSNSFRLINYGYNATVERSPLSRDINPFGLVDRPDNTYYKIWPNDTKYTFCCGKGVCQGINLIVYLNTVVCVAYGTHITMSDGTLKTVENVVRGDWVRGYQGQIYRVADVNKQYVPKKSTIDLIEFLPDCLGLGYPSKRLIVTTNHPIFYYGARRPAKVFRHMAGVIEHIGIKPGTLIQPESVGDTGPVYYLYDLQFDDDGSYLAEGATIQSRSPWSDITPLPRELYYDASRYREETDWDGFNHQLPLDEREIPEDGIETLPPLPLPLLYLPPLPPIGEDEINEGI